MSSGGRQPSRNGASASVICVRISDSGIVAAPSPSCGPYAPKPAWFPPSIMTKTIPAGSSPAAESIFSGVDRASSLPEMLRAASPESEAEMICPRCHCDDVYYTRYSRRAAGVFMLLLGFLLPWRDRRWTCKVCGYAWKER